MRPLLAIHPPPRLARGVSAAAALCLAALVTLGAREARAQACVPEDCLPSPSSAYAGAFTYHFSGVGFSADLSNPVLHNFTSCASPPPSVPSAFVVSSFNALMDFGLSVNGGSTLPKGANAAATIRVAFNHQSGSTRFFDTEMLQLDLSGGTLPAGMLIRESPTLASTGQTTIQDPSGGNFRIDSFFDVFVELSFDGGATWIPSNGPGHMTLTGPGCPTPTRRDTWGRVKVIYR
jgi:hypothetical protein